MLERRKYVRSDGLILVNYKIPALQMEGKSSAFDINALGVRLTVNKELATATLVEMELYLPGDSQPILAKGEVVWAQKYKEKAETQIEPQKGYYYTGIKFTVISENNRTRIIDYVDRKLHR